MVAQFLEISNRFESYALPEEWSYTRKRYGKRLSRVLLQQQGCFYAIFGSSSQKTASVPNWSRYNINIQNCQDYARDVRNDLDLTAKCKKWSDY